MAALAGSVCQSFVQPYSFLKTCFHSLRYTPIINYSPRRGAGLRRLLWQRARLRGAAMVTCCCCEHDACLSPLPLVVLLAVAGHLQSRKQQTGTNHFKDDSCHFCRFLKLHRGGHSGSHSLFKICDETLLKLCISAFSVFLRV